VQGGTAVLLADGRTVRFTPAANANSLNTPGGSTFTYQANDGNWPRDPSYVLSEDSAAVAVAITVNPVNDAPAGTDNTVTMIEDGATIFAAGDFGLADPLDSPVNALNRVQITALPGAGTLTDNGVPVSAGAFVTVANIDAGKLKFTPAANASGSPYASFAFKVEDDGGTAYGGVNLDPTPNTMTINVIPVTWVATTAANCSPAETPEIAIAGNAITMGVVRADLPQNNCIHGASAALPPLTAGNTKYEVTFSYNLFTWDSYNASTTIGTGYWDSFSVSVSGGAPYSSLTLMDPLTGPQTLASGTSFNPGFVWGGSDFSDSVLECNPNGTCTPAPPAAQATVVITGDIAGSNYLNVVLDTKTLPESNHNHASYGTITIKQIRQVP
jgi:hypothetical protein